MKTIRRRHNERRPKRHDKSAKVVNKCLRSRLMGENRTDDSILADTDEIGNQARFLSRPWPTSWGSL